MDRFKKSRKSIQDLKKAVNEKPINPELLRKAKELSNLKKGDNGKED